MSTRAAVACVLAALACAGAAEPTPAAQYEVRAFGRSIELDPYLRVSRAESVYVDQAARRAYLAVGEAGEKHLAELSLSANGRFADFASARRISRVDLAKRNFWGARYSAALGRTLVLTDEAGEERINLYGVQADGTFERLTDVGYIYGWSISPDGRWLAYASRESVEFSPGTIRLLDLVTRKERVLFADSKAMRPYWSTPVWRADGGAFLLTVVIEEDRARQNVAFVPTSGPDAGRPRLVTRGEVPRELILSRSAWIDERSFLYVSTEAGERELYIVTLDGSARRLAATGAAAAGRASSPAGGQLSAASVIHSNARAYAVTVTAGLVQDSIQVLEIPSGRVAYEESLRDTVTLESALGDRAILRTTSQTNPVTLLELAPGKGGGFALRPLAKYAEAAETLVHCVPEKVSYRTFDGLAAPGEHDTLHAWLYRPKRPLPPAQATLIVEAFYGGTRHFNWIYALPSIQLFCAAGIHVLSPAPRGSWGMGTAFRHLIRGDLGGAEILDVLEAAKWGSRTLGIPPERIGAFGLSHGGYATMRAATLPERVNGRRVDFRFGFAISDAGISNLLRHAENSNIRGWSVDLMGEDPQKNPQKWLDRSPEMHAHRLSVPLLLLHGTNDYRVRIVESRAMAEKLRELGKPVTYYELPGMAHGTGPVPQLHAYWHAVFDFLETVVN